MVSKTYSRSHLITTYFRLRCQNPRRFPCCRLFTTQPSPNTRASRLLNQHHHDVDDIASSIRSLSSQGIKYRISHGSTNSTRSRAPGTPAIDISRLNRVIHIDTGTRTALVEPNVPMDRLVEATLPLGLIPPVVMEFPGITVGGGYAGTGGESSSFRHGYFDESINGVEILLASGEKTWCDATPGGKNHELFRAASGSLGTLGVTTAIELRLQPAQKWVETEVWPLKVEKGGNVFESAVKLAEKFAKRSDIDFLDGVLLARDRGAIITGRMVSTATSTLPMRRFSAPQDPWYYLHIDSLTKKGTTASDTTPSNTIREVIPLASYLFRYDRGAFWTAREAFRYFSFPFNRATRYWLDDFLHTRMLYSALHASRQSDRYLVQDFGVPFEEAAAFLSKVVDASSIFPIWLCPLRMRKDTQTGRTFHPHARASALSGQDNKQPSHILNIGLYGPPPSASTSFAALNRQINGLLETHAGTKWLYAQSFYTQSEFWDIYDHEWYQQLRAKYGAQGLPDVWEKVGWKGGESEEKMKEQGNKIWPAAGIRGLRAAIQSGSYLDARRSSWQYWN